MAKARTAISILTNRLLWIMLLAISAIALQGGQALAKPSENVIVLPGASSAEGIAVGNGSTFYAGDFLTGDIFRGSLEQGTAAMFIDAPAGRMAAGMKVDERTGMLFVAGALTGQAYVYDTKTGATLATYQLGQPFSVLINDVVITRDGAWFTESFHRNLYFVPISPIGVLGQASMLTVTGPAAAITGAFNLNGIAVSNDGRTLIVSHTANGALYTINPATGASNLISGVSVPNVDGILLEAGRLYAVQNFSNQVAVIRLSPDLTSGTVESTITSPDFEVPTAVARHGNQLALVNAKFDTGFPATASQYEVVIVDR
jgi:sugar lactone lactonase YvrE